jgi:DNA-binding transcriptional MerR regulator
MPLKIPSEVRASVIRDWLNGKPRDTIAHDNLVSSGAVSNMVNKWRDALTVYDADALRELGIMFRKLGITAPECAIGFRLASILKDLGVDEDKFGDFVSQIYNQCIDIGLKPEYIAYNTKQILDLSGSIPISEIPNYIQEKTNERQKLEEDIKKLGGEQLEALATLATALDENKVYLTELEQFSKLKVELDKLGISAEDIRRTIGIIQSVRQSGYSVENITQLLAAWQASTTIQAELQKKIDSLTVHRAELQEKYDDLWNSLLIHRGKLSLCEDLKEMGFGLKELKQLSGTIKEVAAANNIPPDKAVWKFFEDIEKNYDAKLGYDSKLIGLKSEIYNTNHELITLHKNLANKNKVASALGELILMGLEDQQILNLAWALQSNISNKESLEADLKKYGSLKKAIEELNQKLIMLQSQNKQIESIDSLNKSDLLDMRQMQESTILAILVEVARGENVEFDRLMTAIIETINLARSPDASNMLKKAIDMIQASAKDSQVTPVKWRQYTDG